MITFKKESFIFPLGNMMFFIAGTIGIATKNGYSFGFAPWAQQEYFINPIPSREEKEYVPVEIPWGFNGFDIPDNSSIFGWMQSERYFAHCKDLIRHYFMLKEITEPIKDTVFIHYRAYPVQVADIFVSLDGDYYAKALSLLPHKRVIVISDDIRRAKNVIGGNYEYMNGTTQRDFYLLSHADYVVMSNSSFSWWGAWMSGAQTVCPTQWFKPAIGQGLEDVFCENWIRL